MPPSTKVYTISAKNQLDLHRGAREATIDEIARVATPSPTDTRFPIPHIAVLEAVEETLQATAEPCRPPPFVGRPGPATPASAAVY